MGKGTIIATGSSRFCGSGKNLARVLDRLETRQYKAHLVTSGTPHYIRTVRTPRFISHRVRPPHSDFLRSPKSLELFALAEKITELALEATAASQDRVVLWGTYLFPFAQAALCAKQNVLEATGKRLPLIVTPAGSDIWQIGRHNYHTARTLLFGSHTNGCVTYSQQFADEVSALFAADSAIDVITPFVDSEMFAPIDARAKAKRRALLGIDDDRVVVVAHSNMRPVKRPELAVKALLATVGFAQSRKVTLLMVGPRPWGADCPQLAKLRRFERRALHPKLEIVWTGLQNHVERFLQLGDVALNTSAHDSFNISLLEAMSCGLPCVTTDVVGIAPVIKRAMGGLVVSLGAGKLTGDREDLPMNEDQDWALELAGALRELLADRNKCEDMGRAARSYVVSLGGEAKALDAYEALFQRVTAI